MKASIKFRDDQKPLMRAKIPINIMSFPFQSGVAAGESKELCLNLATFFDSGPSLKFSYRPNDPHNPFTFVFKTGVGHFGSPNRSALNMSAEFNLIGTRNPSFFIHFKPEFGDFALKKSHSSEFVKGLAGDKFDGGVASEDSFVDNGYLKGTGFFSSSVDSKAAAGVVSGLIRGVEMSARTVLPIQDFALLNFRWGLRIARHETVAADTDAVMVGKRGIGIGLPLLVMNKIGIEHITKSKPTGEKTEPAPKYAEIADACLEMKKQMELIQAENGLLSKALRDLRSEIAVGKMDFLPYERRSKGSKLSPEMKGFDAKSPVGEARDELKALM
ncbi:hypothetical protein F511_07619 [Dorcoceras hygrometricum]|uniref:Uncharacterized protein n=1 Tax=Dorcoceras hygrometricum TaxID=472368 RepID=A0A2Z7D253_9LAMI|nr:hypothetical protein F511_07619 [Dorcoceras hygrometricum]